MSREEVLIAIRQCAAELGRCPTVAELKKQKNIGLRTVRRFFPNYADALREAGFDPHGPGYRVTLDELFADWARVARQAGKIPTLAEYEKYSQYSVGPLLTRFGGWTEVPRGLLQFAREKRMEDADADADVRGGEWQDVLEQIKAHESREGVRRGGSGVSSPASARSRTKAAGAGPVYGSPLTPGALSHAPTNEMGVVYAFGMLAGRLGFVVTRMQSGFPDCEAMREVEHNQWRRVRVEFEFESRNFLTHQHDPGECDLIVCWVHNWPECPESLEVVELSGVMRGERESGHHGETRKSFGS